MKKIISLTLGLLLVFGSIGVAFAAEADTESNNTTFNGGNGIRLYAQGLTAEELLSKKIERIDQMVSDGKITSEEGEKYKATISERMKNCTVPGENRENNERLGIGFGRGRNKGNGLGRGVGRNAR